jgi:hypothetical protein
MRGRGSAEGGGYGEDLECDWVRPGGVVDGEVLVEGVMIILLCMYAPLFFIFFLSNSLRVNGAMRVEGDPEWRSHRLTDLRVGWGAWVWGKPTPHWGRGVPSLDCGAGTRGR